MKKPKYVSIKKLIDADYQYNILLGQRSNGKSYAVKQHCLTHFWKTGKRFVYLRRYQMEVKASDVEAYFRDAPVEAITGGEYTIVSSYRGGIYLSNMDDNGKVIRGKQCGYIAYLSNEVHFKSQNFNDVDNIIYEEFITDQGYLYREPEKLESIISTIARKRQLKVWLIGNTISRLCPYFNEWGLSKGIPRQKQGTIEIYEHETDQIYEDTGEPVVIRIAVYFCEETANTSKMFFGSSAGMITKGVWQTRSYPHLPYHYRDCKKLYELLYKHLEFTFKIEAIRSPEGEYMAFIHPHNEDDYKGRIVSDQPAADPRITKKLDPIRKGDKLIRWCFDMGKVFYSDNLTGADWEACVDNGSFL